MSAVRSPAVAGLFYPASAEELRQTVREYLAQGQERFTAHGQEAPAAVVAPHAGYVYSGPVAGTAFAAARKAQPQRVVLMGPAHTLYLQAIALPEAEAMLTPLGRLPIDARATEQLAGVSPVRRLDAAHASEHCLEVELPFLQELFGEVPIVPLVVGDVPGPEVARVLRTLWDPDTFVVISSDLSHYLPYESARQKDRATAEAIETLRPELLDEGSACGRVPLQGLLQVARERAYRVQCLDLRNSGDTAGPPGRVVGYGAFAVAS